MAWGIRRWRAGPERRRRCRGGIRPTLRAFRLAGAVMGSSVRPGSAEQRKMIG
jgi:hypothetical protein